MAKLTGFSPAAAQLVKALGLPDDTSELVLSIRAGGCFATLEVKTYVDESRMEEVTAILKRFELNEITDTGT